MSTEVRSHESTTTTEAQPDLSNMDFAEYEKARNAGKSLEEMAEKSEPASEDAEQKAAAESDTAEPEAKEAKDESDDEEADEAAESDDAEKDEKPKKKSGAQRRRERAERAEAEAARAREEVEYWKQQALKGAGADKKDEKPKASTEAGKPNPDNFETYAEYTEALTDWKLEQREKASKEAASKAAIEAEQKSLIEAHSKRVKAFAEKTPDFQDVIADVSHITPLPVVERLLLESENGPELFYKLAQNPDEWARINRLGPVAAALEIGRLDAKVALSKESAKKTEPKKLTNAPKPIAPVGTGGKATVEKSIDDPTISFEEYERIRTKQLKAKR